MWDLVPGSSEELELYECFWSIYRAPFRYWTSLPLWEAREAAALLLGIDPDKIDEDYKLSDEDIDFEHFGHPLKTFQIAFDENLSYQRKILKNQTRLIERAAIAGQFQQPANSDAIFPIAPARVIAWADKYDPKFPKALSKNLTGEVEDETDTYEAISPRREKSLLRIIGALLAELRNETSDSQAKIIEQIVDLHGHKDGISASGLENVFAGANRQLDDW